MPGHGYWRGLSLAVQAQWAKHICKAGSSHVAASAAGRDAAASAADSGSEPEPQPKFCGGGGTTASFSPKGARTQHVQLTPDLLHTYIYIAVF